MSNRKTWPTGIRPSTSGIGIQIRVWRKGVQIYTETIAGDANKASDLASAIRRRDGIKQRLDLGLPAESSVEHPVEIREFLVVAQEYLDTLDVKRSTMLSYENILNKHWVPEFEALLISQITTAKIKRVLAKIKVSNKTKKNILIPLRGILYYAEVNPNPAAAVRIKRRQAAKIQRYSIDERQRLLSALSGQELVYFALLFGCGLRSGEALALQWSDYNGKALSISKQITRRTLEAYTKTDVIRTTMVPVWAREILNAHVTRFTGGCVFVNTFGRPHLDTDIFNSEWQRIHAKLRIPYRIPYTCRHTRAAELLSIGIDASDAAKQLGHSKEMFLRTYSEWIDEYATNLDPDRFDGVRPELRKIGKDI